MTVGEQEAMAVPDAPLQPDEGRPGKSGDWVGKLGFRRFSGLYVWGGIIIVFSIWATSTFFTVTNVRIVASEQAITAMLALAAMVPLVCGVFDLSVAQMMGFAALVVALLQANFNLNPILAVIVTLVVGLMVGTLNAYIVVRLRVNAFIGTLAMTSILHALGYWVTGSQDITAGIRPSFTSVGRWHVPFFQVSSTVLFMLGMGLVLWYVLARTPVGRSMYAVGDNAQAAKLAGVRSDRVIGMSFLVSSLLASVVGIIYVSQVGVAPLEAAPPYLLPAFSAVFLGATQIIPGRFNVVGTLVAVYMIATGVKGLQLTVAAPWVNDLFVGVALILAVALTERERRPGRTSTRAKLRWRMNRWRGPAQRRTTSND